MRFGRHHPRVDEVGPARALELARDGALLLDVREPDEWRAGHIRGSVHVPLGALDPTGIPRDVPVVAVCRSGNRSGTAAAALAAHGYDVVNLAGGVTAWQRAGLALVTDDGEPGWVR
ncbi:rhodanese-like domain-containing protein [Nocardioides sp. T2.26MG-1]|uniref:rhodanese-like domain-containing protein n=1 Tax=Nocardioides sp. T2.26MG-1 TaxID=3041166 RepID=UPI002477A678|nr:rhodanese-like domain-containing protein [Nocardioides sp. T2.26MG-1]CAI9410456.1 Thiosulfate sulfurtransferase GlpE [Nocardioides sp. T2.26MG-1]